MAQPQQAMGHGGPMRGVRQIHVNADGSVQQGDWVKFAPAGQIQFVAAPGLPANINAVFTPALFGSSTSGVQPIFQNNAQNPPLNPNNNANNTVASYMITGAGISSQARTASSLAELRCLCRWTQRAI